MGQFLKSHASNVNDIMHGRTMVSPFREKNNKNYIIVINNIVTNGFPSKNIQTTHKIKNICRIPSSRAL